MFQKLYLQFNQDVQDSDFQFYKINLLSKKFNKFVKYKILK